MHIHFKKKLNTCLCTRYWLSYYITNIMDKNIKTLNFYGYETKLCVLDVNILEY